MQRGLDMNANEKRRENGQNEKWDGGRIYRLSSSALQHFVPRYKTSARHPLSGILNIMQQWQKE